MTEEEAKQAVIDAALNVCGDWPTAVSQYDYGLRAAVDAYRKATAPPEPVEGYVAVRGGRLYGSSYPTSDAFGPTIEAVWEVQITPVRRVR